MKKGRVSKPQIRVLVDDAVEQFTQDGKRVIETLLFYLWDNAEIQNIFVNEYFIQ